VRKKKPYVYQNQLKTLISIEDKINDLIKHYCDITKSRPNVFFRTTIEPHSPTLYKTESIGKENKIWR